MLRLVLKPAAWPGRRQLRPGARRGMWAPLPWPSRPSSSAPHLAQWRSWCWRCCGLRACCGSRTRLRRRPQPTLRWRARSTCCRAACSSSSAHGCGPGCLDTVASSSLQRQQDEPLLLAQTGAHHALRPLLMPAVWLMALLSGGVAVASCMVNDYFDMRSDTINAPHKVAPMPLGGLPASPRLELTQGHPAAPSKRRGPAGRRTAPRFVRLHVRPDCSVPHGAGWRWLTTTPFAAAHSQEKLNLR